MGYEEALKLMQTHTKNEALRRHMYAVEAGMRAYAKKFGEDEETWAIVGLLHDFDYEMYPNAPDHPAKGSEILEKEGYSEAIRRAILSHADYMNVPRDTTLAKALFACDEACGFISAVAVIRPNKIRDLEVSSVKKKLKDKGFARNVSREDIENGVRELGVTLDDHLKFLIDAMRGSAERLGL